MERLTEKHYLGTDHYMKCSGKCNVDMDCIDCPSFDCLVERLAAYEDTGLEPEEITAMQHTLDEYHKVADPLLRAQADGRLVVLPCKVGDIVWANLDKMRHTRKCVIEFANIGSHVTTIVFSTVDGLREQYGVNPCSFGKTVFLTREEAEKVLEAKEGCNP